MRIKISNVSTYFSDAMETEVHSINDDLACGTGNTLPGCVLKLTES